jgi:hypothetical protein
LPCLESSLASDRLPCMDLTRAGAPAAKPVHNKPLQAQSVGYRQRRSPLVIALRHRSVGMHAHRSLGSLRRMMPPAQLGSTAQSTQSQSMPARMGERIAVHRPNELVHGDCSPRQAVLPARCTRLWPAGTCPVCTPSCARVRWCTNNDADPAHCTGHTQRPPSGTAATQHVAGGINWQRPMTPANTPPSDRQFQGSRL